MTVDPSRFRLTDRIRQADPPATGDGPFEPVPLIARGNDGHRCAERDHDVPLVMAAFMLVGAKLGDILGRDRAVGLGLDVFGLGSLITALSPNFTVNRSRFRIHMGESIAFAAPPGVSVVASRPRVAQREGGAGVDGRSSQEPNSARRNCTATGSGVPTERIDRVPRRRSATRKVESNDVRSARRALEVPLAPGRQRLARPARLGPSHLAGHQPAP
jgi:hypothetical protein